MVQSQKKLNIRFGKGGQYTALFSNIGQKDPNSFYLLMTYISKSKNPCKQGLSVEDCNRLLKKENEDYFYNGIVR